MSQAPSPAAPDSDRPDSGGQDFGGIDVVLFIEDEGWLADGLGDLDGLVRRCVAAAARRAGLPAGLRTEVGATFTSDAAVRRLNAEWRGKDQATNVLSFPLADLEPGDVPGAMLGDLVFARQTLRREATAEGKTLRDHLCHLVVHGFLHCLGHDHGEAGEAEAMERLEILILADLGVSDPYSSSEPAAADRLAG